jgi:hypothetical protein
VHVEPFEDGVQDEWDGFCRDHAWFWHTTRWRDFLFAARPQREGRSLFFGVRDRGDLLAVVPLALERHDDRHELSLGGGPCWAPAVRTDLDEATSASVLRVALEQVDELARAHDAERAGLALSPLVPSFAQAVLRFGAAATRAGWLDIGRTTQVLELGPGIESLRRGMSKGHRAAVKRGTASLDVEVLTGTAMTREAMDAYRELHARAAGRVTQPLGAFELMEGWARDGVALLALARRDGRPVGGSYVNVFGAGAYYSQAAIDPDLRSEPVGHAIQSALLAWLVEHDVERYELGLQQFGPLLHDVPSDKERNIARFKRGFGGETRLFVVREKWFSAAAFERTQRARLEAYAAALRADAAARSLQTEAGAPAPPAG